MVGSGLIALLVTLFTKGKRESELEGLVVGTLWRAKEIYKGGKPNEEEGLTVECVVREAAGGPEGADGLGDQDVPGEISVNRRVAGLLRADLGDIVYLSDSRWWLGGLRSVHAKLSDVRDDDDSTVVVARSLVSEGSLRVDRPHKIEKIF